MFSVRSIFIVIGCLVSQGSIAGAEPFPIHLEMNEKVEVFTNILVKGLMPSFSKTSVVFKRDQQGKVIDEFGYGAINANFSGTVAPVSEGERGSQFEISTTVDTALRTQAAIQYTISLRLNGTISNPKNYLLKVFQQPTCATGSSQSYLCQIAEKIDFSKDFQAQIAPALLAVKEDLLASVAQIEDRKRGEFLGIRDEFLAYLDERIQVGTASLEIDLSDLGDIFRKPAENWLDDNNLINYRIQKLSMQFNDGSIFVDAHLTKFHGTKSWDSFMEGISHMQRTLESEEVARLVAEQSQGRSITELHSSIKDNAFRGDKLRASVTVGVGLTTGSNNSGIVPETTDEELELGLE